MSVIVSIEGVGKFDIMFEEHTESYTNTLTPTQVRKTGHPREQRWGKGQTDSITFELMIVAGLSSEVATADDVIKKCAAAMGRAVLGKLGSANLVKTVVKIGSWYSRICLCESASVTFMSPWDVAGKPMRARIQMTFVPDGKTHKPEPLKYKFNA